MRRNLLILAALALTAALTGRLYMTSNAQPAGHDTDHGGHPHAAALKNADGSWKYTNALAQETSPYLLQHAHNPVDWHPWGDAAFELAREQQKPIFLSVGYSTCYWCHVMERQVFENPDIAAKMNELFINIKADREERPDVDDIYMTATQLMTRSGGWPMSVFLTPPPPAEGASAPVAPQSGYGLKPFWAGTYIPPKPAYGRPSFPQVLDGLHAAWTDQRGQVLEQADRLADAVAQTLAAKAAPGPLTAAPVTRAAQSLMRGYDPEHGGFGDAPKFPQPANLSFLFAVHNNKPGSDIGPALHRTLDAMARGGMYDQVGGGFHRYSVDEKWLVPHFEKMLYDNGQLLSVYARGLEDERATHGRDTARATQYERVIRETGGYLIREMLSHAGPEAGMFWSAQDAEVNAREGENYLWTEAQIRRAIDDDALADLAVTMYGVDRGTNFRDPHAPDAEPTNVLFLPRPLDELATQLSMDRAALAEKRERINARLMVERGTRDQPGTDDKVITAWNGLAIKGLAEAGHATGDDVLIEAASNAANAVVEHLAESEGAVGLYRTRRDGRARVPAFLEDFTHLTAGLLALHRAGVGDGNYLRLAEHFTDAAIQRFARDGGGYYDTRAGQGDLFVRVAGVYDGAVPAGNSVMIHNLLDLAQLTDDPAERQRYLDRAVRDLRSFADALQQRGAGMVHMQHALLRALELAPHALAIPASAGTEDPDDPAVVIAVSTDDIRINADQPATFTVTLDIAEGYHLNSDQPPLDALVPTRLLVDGGRGVRIDVAYPEPVERKFDFADQPLPVYEGKVTITATLHLEGENHRLGDARLRLQYQACNDSACLAPRTVDLPATISLTK